MMTDNEKEFFKALLLKQLNELMGNAGQTVQKLLGDVEHYTDLIDCAAFESAQSTLLRLRDRESKLIRKILEALDRLENDVFGECESCGEEIGLPRLKARPVTALCIRCKERMESNENMRKNERNAERRHYLS